MGSRSAGVRRLLKESAEMSLDTDPSYTAAPLEDDLFSWHFTIKGPGGDYEGGIYHGRMQLPPNYPFAPPEILLLTQSGRFEVNKKICLSISSFHPESWQPSWGIRTALIALTAFFDSEPKGAVGSLDAPPEERRRLATLSREYSCPTCGFDASSPFEFTPAIEGPSSVLEETPEPTEVESNENENEEKEDEDATAATTIFPSPRGGMNVPPSLTGNANVVVGGVGANGIEIPPPALPPARPIEQPAPLPLAERQAPRPILAVTVATTAGANRSNEGGAPLLVDRAILVVLVALLALVVNRIA